jgi:predicted nuclease of predicted toxin-antitoxin system
MLPILVDEDMPRPTAGLLQSLGIDAIDLRDIGLKGATDAEVFEHAQKQRMIIISRDKEFSNILKYPLGTHHGIIWVNLPYTFIRHQILDAVKRFFVGVERSRLPNNLTILEVGRYRIRERSLVGPPKKNAG